MYQLCIAKDDILVGHDFHVVTLQHPKTDEAAQFAFSQDYTALNEILRHKPDFGSWFVGNEVSSEGSILYITKCDLLFLIIPYLIKQHKTNPERYSPLEQILEDERFPNTRKLCRCHAVSALDTITDFKGADDYKAYRYNSDKTLQWLKKKVDRLAQFLEKLEMHVGEGAQSTNFVRSKNDTSANSEDHRLYAFTMVSDYLSADLKNSLRISLGLPKEEAVIKEEPAAKKAKLGGGSGPVEDYSKGVLTEKQLQDKKPTALEKKLKKIDTTGMKSITSFFKVKPKSTK